MNYSMLNFLERYSVYILAGVIGSTIAGLLAYLIWLFLVKRAAEFVVRHAMAYLKFEMVCFTAPILCSIFYKLWGRKAGWVQVSTMPMVFGILVLTALWMAAIVVVLVYRYVEYCKRRWLCFMNKPEEEEYISAIVENWKSRLGITVRTTLFYNEGIDSPLIMYNKGYQILLPTYPMTEKELNMGLLHELVHLKHGDVRTKNLAFIVNALHFFNPASYFLRKEVEKWAEVHCDWSTCEVGKEEFSRGEYFNSIMDLKNRSKAVSYPDTVCFLMERDGLLKFRIDMMGLRRKEKQRHHVGGVVWIVTLMALLMTASLWFVSGGLTYGIEKSISLVKEEPQEEMGDISSDPIFDNARKSYWDGDILNGVESADFELEAGEIEMFELSGQCGNTIAAAVICDDGDYRMGCIGKDGHVECMDGSGSAAMDFELPEGNIEEFFIQNTGKTSCRIELFISN